MCNDQESVDYVVENYNYDWEYNVWNMPGYHGAYTYDQWQQTYASEMTVTVNIMCEFIKQYICTQNVSRWYKNCFKKYGFHH